MAVSAQSLQTSSSALARLWQSSLGKKYVMAVTGLGLWLFVIIHMLGNLQIFTGPEHLNAYGHALKSTPALLWGARIGLFTLGVLQVVAARELARENRTARPNGSGDKKTVASSFAQR